MNSNKKERKGFSIHILWGFVFAILGITELIKRYEIVYGIPIWALCFFAIAASNFLREPFVLQKINVPDEKLPTVHKTASILNTGSIIILVMSFIIELIRN
ncbi:hypothetical protein J7M07_06285 [bacterium]|nr:hypothetical protein [bacterium]